MRRTYSRCLVRQLLSQNARVLVICGGPQVCERMWDTNALVNTRVSFKDRYAVPTVTSVVLDGAASTSAGQQQCPQHCSTRARALTQGAHSHTIWVHALLPVRRSVECCVVPLPKWFQLDAGGAWREFAAGVPSFRSRVAEVSGAMRHRLCATVVVCWRERECVSVRHVLRRTVTVPTACRCGR